MVLVPNMENTYNIKKSFCNFGSCFLGLRDFLTKLRTNRVRNSCPSVALPSSFGVMKHFALFRNGCELVSSSKNLVLAARLKFWNHSLLELLGYGKLCPWGKHGKKIKLKTSNG